MKLQRRIPIFFRMPLALLSHGLVAFGPMIGLWVFKPFSAPPWVLIGIGVAWIIVYDRFLMWRLDSFWNVRCMQNRTGRPPTPDNFREFTSVKGWLGWGFLGIDCENTTTNNAADSTDARVTPPAGHESRHGQP